MPLPYPPQGSPEANLHQGDTLWSQKHRDPALGASFRVTLGHI